MSLWDYYLSLAKGTSSPVSMLSPILPVMYTIIDNTARFHPDTQTQASGSGSNTNTDFLSGISKSIQAISLTGNIWGTAALLGAAYFLFKR